MPRLLMKNKIMLIETEFKSKTTPMKDMLGSSRWEFKMSDTFKCLFNSLLSTRSKCNSRDFNSSLVEAVKGIFRN